MIDNEEQYLEYMHNNMQIGMQYLKLILDEFYDKNYILECRLKSIEKIHRKQEFLKRKFPQNIELFSNISSIPDIVGFRIAVDSEEDAQEIAQFLSNGNDLCKTFNYYKNPKGNGFRAILLQFHRISSNFKYEIQVMTKQMREWTNATHQEYEEEKYGIVQIRSFK